MSSPNGAVRLVRLTPSYHYPPVLYQDQPLQIVESCYERNDSAVIGTSSSTRLDDLLHQSIANAHFSDGKYSDISEIKATRSAGRFLKL